MDLWPNNYASRAKQNWLRLKNAAVISILLGISAILIPSNNAKAQQGTSESSAVEPQPAQHKPSLAEAAGIAQGKVIYRDVVLIDGTSQNARSDMAIAIQDDRITAIVPNSEVSETMLDGAFVYDMAGEYVLPGLIDSHVHLATWPHRVIASAYMKRYIYGGITGVRDMAGDVRALADISRASLVNEIPAPDLYYSSLMAGPDFFSDPRTVTSGLGGVPGKLPWMQAITDDSEIALMVAQARGTSATGIKIYANLPGNLVQAIIDEGKKQNFPVWSHLQVYPATPYDSLGAKVVSHVCMIARYVGERNKQRYGHDNPPSYDGITADHPEIRKYISALLKSGTTMEATLSVYDDISTEQGPALKEDGTPQRPGCSRALAADITAAMHEAGVPIIAGTDRSAPAHDPFPKLYEEMEALVNRAGLTPQQAIMSATSVAARGLGKSQDIGTLEAGKFANMVFVKDDPLADISALRSISLTVKRGHRFVRKDYEHKNIPELVYPE